MGRLARGCAGRAAVLEGLLRTAGTDDADAAAGVSAASGQQQQQRRAGKAGGKAALEEVEGLEDEDDDDDDVPYNAEDVAALQAKLDAELAEMFAQLQVRCG